MVVYTMFHRILRPIFGQRGMSMGSGEDFTITSVIFTVHLTYLRSLNLED